MRTPAELIEAINQISTILKGHDIPFTERLMLHQDRKDLRAELASTQRELAAKAQQESTKPVEKVEVV